MKNLLIGIFALTTSGLLAAFGDPAIDRAVKIDNTKQLVLAENGKSNAVIVVSPGATKVAQFAAEELQKFLQESTGAKFAIVSQADPNKVSIIVGCQQSAAQLPADAFIIKADGNKIIIAGKDDQKTYPGKDYRWGDYYERATLFGAYDFLERFLGAKFVFPGKYGTVVPKHRVLKVPAMDIVERPDNIARSISWDFGKWYDNSDAKEVMYLKKLNTYRLRTQTDYIPNCHGLGRMAYIERFGEKHPEYFALRPNGTRSNLLSENMGGQLCFSSAIVEEIYQDAKAFLLKQPAASRGIRHTVYRNAAVWDANAAKNNFFNIMPQDGMTGCQCSKCKALAAQDPKWASNQVWQLTVDSANRLRKENVPGYLTQMAYGHLVNIPEFAIPDNVLVMVATLGPWGKYHQNGWKSQLTLVDNWVKKLNNHKTWLWTYVNKYSGRQIADVPCATPRAVGEFFTDLKHNIFGGFMESETDRTVYQFFNWYVYCKLMWDKSIDIDQLLNETYAALYGKGADDMKKFFEEFEYVWLKEITGKVIMDETGPVSIQPTDSELWNKIYNGQFISKTGKYLADAKRKAADDQEAVERIEFIGDQYLGNLTRARNKFIEQQSSIGTLKKNIRKVADNTVAIDGNIAEEAWKQADVIYLRGLAGQKTEVATQVRLLHDSKNLYISYVCEEPEMANCFAPKLANDDFDVWQSNSAEFFINPDGSRNNYFQFIVSQAGNITDSFYTFDGQRMIADRQWNSDAQIKITNQEKSWTLEMAIPLKKLGKINEENLAADFARNRMHKGLFRGTRYYNWSPYARKYHDYVNFGNLSFKEVKDTNVLNNGNFQGDQKGRLFFLFDEKGKPVKNGGWFADQKDVDNKQVRLDTETFLFDGKSLRIDNDGKSICLTQYLPNLDVNKTYKLSFSVKTKMVKPGKYSWAVADLYNGKKRIGCPQPPIRGTSDWTTYSVTFKPDPAYAEKKTAYLRLYSYCFHGTVWFDGVRIEEVK